MNKSGVEMEKIPDEAIIKILGQRVIVMFAGTFQELARGIEAAIGSQAEGVLYDAGIYSGKNSTMILLKLWKERGEDFLKKWANFYGSAGVGWFKVNEMNIDLDNGTGYIRITESFSSERYTITEDESKASKKDMCLRDPTSHLLTGFFVGVFEELSGQKLVCTAINCFTKKGAYLEFRLSNY